MSPPPALRTRRPTGRVAFPLILVEGEEKAGKTFAALRLSASPRIGRTFVLDLGEGTADEYAELGEYEILEHDGTWHQLWGQTQAAIAVPSDPERPNLIVVDSDTEVWNLLKGWVDVRARNSKRGRQTLQRDPDAEIDAPTNLWNDAKDRWNALHNALRAWPGVAIVIAHGKEVTKFANGQPVAGETEWKVEAERTLPFAVTGWVRMRRPHQATLIAARSLHVDVPANGLRLPEENPLEHLVFEILGAGGSFQRSSAVAGVSDERRADEAWISTLRSRGAELPPPQRERLNAHFRDHGYRLETLTVPQAAEIVALLDVLEEEAAEEAPHNDESGALDVVGDGEEPTAETTEEAAE